MRKHDLLEELESRFVLKDGTMYLRHEAHHATPAPPPPHIPPPSRRHVKPHVVEEPIPRMKTRHMTGTKGHERKNYNEDYNEDDGEDLGYRIGRRGNR